jgi:hypothetical protein
LNAKRSRPFAGASHRACERAQAQSLQGVDLAFEFA